ncbi:hypothetical protein C0Q70_03086 [Pomacea canaliculata]|uniref:Major facilitator superfamily (MFS) profile domain-containing protein n=2 Tax=Pomacea canaliculata TaxID=400727 RepID=A0A2T7PRR0_POMCA|nr:hypothetical protein C0Q70_03086 [Pomacea canaliculata]
MVINNEDGDEDNPVFHRKSDYGSVECNHRLLYPALPDVPLTSPAASDEPPHKIPGISTSPPAEVPEEFKLYKRRWYILMLYSLLAATQSGVWNTFSPIKRTTEDAFGWNDATIALLGNWGPIAYLVVGIVFSWMMDVKGLRISCLLTALLIAVGTSLRCITMDPPAATWLMHIGQILNGLAGPVASAAPPFLSAIWFAPHERTTATAIAVMLNSLGMAVMFVLGPALVPDATNSTKESAHIQSLFQPWEDNQFISNFWNVSAQFDADSDAARADRISREKHGLRLYMYIVAGWSIALFLAMLIYFPSKPPRPPSASASIQRSNFLAGLKDLGRRGQFWLVCAIYGISLGVLGSWNGVLEVILQPLEIYQKEAGWIGFYGQCGGAVASLLVARFADFFTRILKWLIIVFYTIGTAALLVFTLIACGVLPFSTGMVYASNIIGTTALNAAVPLIFELACELSYPTGEGTANGVLTMVYNFVSVVILFIFMIPNIGSMWANWALVGSSGFCVFLLFLLKETYNRLDIDDLNPTLESIDTEIIIPDPHL